MEEAVRSSLEGGRVIEDSEVLATANGFSHADLVGVCKSLATGGFIETEPISRCGARSA